MKIQSQNTRSGISHRSSNSEDFHFRHSISDCQDKDHAEVEIEFIFHVYLRHIGHFRLSFRGKKMNISQRIVLFKIGIRVNICLGLLYFFRP